MKNSKSQQRKLMYTTDVSESTKKGEFFIELYSCSQNSSEKTPLKTIRNFDELIDFFEAEEEENL